MGENSGARKFKRFIAVTTLVAVVAFVALGAGEEVEVTTKLFDCTATAVTVSLEVPFGEGHDVYMYDPAGVHDTYSGIVTFSQHGRQIGSEPIASSFAYESTMPPGRCFGFDAPGGGGPANRYLRSGQRYEISAHFTILPAHGAVLYLGYMQSGYQWVGNGIRGLLLRL